jgi:hypothetical protein
MTKNNAPKPWRAYYRNGFGAIEHQDQEPISCKGSFKIVVQASTGSVICYAKMVNNPGVTPGCTEFFAENGVTMDDILNYEGDTDDFFREMKKILEINEKDAVATPKKAECTCDSRDLLNFGCKCGFLKPFKSSSWI